MKRNVTAILLAILMLVMLPCAAMAHSYNGAEIPFTDWVNAGFVDWQQTSEGILVPTAKSDFALLRLEKDLGDKYCIEFDVKQEQLSDGWQTINIGFDVNAGENNTQSGFTLDLHNAGVARVILYNQANAGAGVQGSYDNPFAQIGYAGSTEWRHIKIQRDGSSFTINVDNDVLSFTCDSVNGGHLVLGAVGNRDVSYRNVVITDSNNQPVQPPVDADPTGDIFGTVVAVMAVSGLGITVLAKKKVF